MDVIIMLKQSLRTSFVAVLTCLLLVNADRGGKPFYYEDEDGRIMEVRRSGYPFVKRACECYCLIAGDESSLSCCIECHVTQSVCFPGSAHVTLHNGDVIKMADVNVGDEILTASETGEVQTTPVLGFLTFDPHVIGSYYRITVESGESLLLSRSHLVFAATTNISDQALPVYAANVEKGQYLLVQSGDSLVPKRVTSSIVENHEGAYVPLTSHGTLLVDGIKASSYAAFPHDLSHVFLTPLRWFPSLMTYWAPTNGDHPYITFMKAFGDVVAPASRFSTSGDDVSKTMSMSGPESDSMFGVSSTTRCT